MKSENFVARGNLMLFVSIVIIIVMAMSGFGWSGYAFVSFLYTIFISTFFKRKIYLSKYPWIPSVSPLTIRGTRAVALSLFILLALTVIFLLFQTNIMELFVLSNYHFRHKIDFISLVIGFPIGITIGLLQSRFSEYWEEICLQKYM